MAPAYGRYWSSKEYDNNETFFDFSTGGYAQWATKVNTFAVRAIRKF